MPGETPLSPTRGLSDRHQAEWDAAATAERGEWSEVLFKGWDMGDDASEKQKWHAWRLAGNFM